MRLIEGGDILSKTQMYFDDSSQITVPEMKAKLRRLKDVDLVIIDYLQLMSGSRRTDNRVQEILRNHEKSQNHGKRTDGSGYHAFTAVS